MSIPYPSNKVKPSHSIVLMTHLFFPSVPTLAHFTHIQLASSILAVHIAVLTQCCENNFIIGMHVKKKQLIYRVQFSVWGIHGMSWNTSPEDTGDYTSVEKTDFVSRSFIV